MRDLLYIKCPKTLEENETIKVGICCFILLECGVLFTIVKSHSHFMLYLPIASIIAFTYFFIFASIGIYEFYIYLRVEYVLYVVGNEDTLVKISKVFLPECNPWRTAELIKNKNNVNDPIFKGQKLLIPMRK